MSRGLYDPGVGPGGNSIVNLLLEKSIEWGAVTEGSFISRAVRLSVLGRLTCFKALC